MQYGEIGPGHVNASMLKDLDIRQEDLLTMKYVYPCNIVPDEEKGGEGYVVTFPEVYGAITGGRSWEEAMENAKDALVAALGARAIANESRFPYQMQSPMDKFRLPFPMATAAKVALNRAMSQRGMTLAELAKESGT